MTSHNKFAGFIKRLRSDTSGNALMIGAAAMFPLIGIAGGAVDMSRIYAAKTRLQHACDAGVLAGRQTMTTKVWTTDAATVGKRFFDINFPEGKYGTHFPTPMPGKSKGINFVPNTDGSVKAVAEAIVPMSLMQIFGQTENKIEVDCKAQINLPNTDVMMVLDTTASMGETNPLDTKSRFVVMKEAVTKFHKSISDANGSGSAVRFGFVPYSSNVNVGGLLKPEWIADKWDYQSRKPDGIEAPTGDPVTSTSWSNSDWTAKSGTRTYSETTYPGEGCNGVTIPAPTVVWGGDPILSETALGGVTTREREWSANGTDYKSWETKEGCVVQTIVYANYVESYTQTGTPQTSVPQPKYLWEYDKIEYNVSGLNAVGDKITVPIGDNHTNADVVWNGCIEERRTEVDPDGDYATIPNNAYDMQIDEAPTANPQTQWAPALPDLVYSRESFSIWQLPKIPKTSYNLARVDSWSGGKYATCPSPAKKLEPLTELDVTNYLATLQPGGMTYHDIGMIWGARLLSPTGIFKSENQGANARHMIFMTDGKTDTMPQVYGAYGWTALDRRLQDNLATVPTKAELDRVTENRFAAMCRATRAKGITIWVIAFGTEETQLLKDCAGSDDRSFMAGSELELGAAFNEIAGKIAHLRLVD